MRKTNRANFYRLILSVRISSVQYESIRRFCHNDLIEFDNLCEYLVILGQKKYA